MSVAQGNGGPLDSFLRTMRRSVPGDPLLELRAAVYLISGRKRRAA